MLVLAEYFLSLLLLPDKFPRHLYFVDKRQSGIKTLQSGVLRSETREREIQIIPLNPSDRAAGLGQVFYHFTLNIEARTRSASDDKMNHGSNTEIRTRIFIRQK